MLSKSWLSWKSALIKLPELRWLSTFTISIYVLRNCSNLCAIERKLLVLLYCCYWTLRWDPSIIKICFAFSLFKSNIQLVAEMHIHLVLCLFSWLLVKLHKRVTSVIGWAGNHLFVNDNYRKTTRSSFF